MADIFPRAKVKRVGRVIGPDWKGDILITDFVMDCRGLHTPKVAVVGRQLLVYGWSTEDLAALARDAHGMDQGVWSGEDFGGEG